MVTIFVSWKTKSGISVVDLKLGVHYGCAIYFVVGASHADDLGYLFKTVLTPDLEPGSIEDVSVRKLTKIWTTFAKYGNPNSTGREPVVDIEWKPVTAVQMNFVDIREKLSAGVNPEGERMKFWDEISRGNFSASIF